MESTEGFTLVLAGLKAFLEHDLRLNLIADKFPGDLGEQHQENLKKVRPRGLPDEKPEKEKLTGKRFIGN